MKQHTVTMSFSSYLERFSHWIIQINHQDTINKHVSCAFPVFLHFLVQCVLINHTPSSKWNCPLCIVYSVQYHKVVQHGAEFGLGIKTLYPGFQHHILSLWTGKSSSLFFCKCCATWHYLLPVASETSFLKADSEDRLQCSVMDSHVSRFCRYPGHFEGSSTSKVTGLLWGPSAALHQYTEIAQKHTNGILCQ